MSCSGAMTRSRADDGHRLTFTDHDPSPTKDQMSYIKSSLVPGEFCLCLLSLLFLLSSCGISRVPLEQRQLVTVHEVQGKDRAALFNLSRTWFVNTFRDSKAVLEIQDKEAGQLFGKGVVMGVVPLTLGGGARVSISIDVKDERYRTTMEPLNFVATTGYERELEESELPGALEGCKRLDAELAAFIAKGSKDF